MRPRLRPLLCLLALLSVASAAAQVVIPHEMGETTIDSTPVRIVTLEYSFADHLARLGLKPVGIAREASIPGYLEPYVGDVPGVGTRAEPSLEAIVALDPDLIVADLRRHSELYEQLSAIAPTLVFNSLRGSYEDQLEAFTALGRALDRSEQAQEALAAHRELFRQTEARVTAEAPRVLTGVLSPGLFTAHTSESFMGSFLAQLGLPAALEPRDGETQFSLSLEGIVAARPQAIVLLCNPGDSTPFEEWAKQPLWNALDAVREERVYLFNRDLWSKGRGLIAFDLILGDLQDSGLLAGAPANTPRRCAEVE